ncbi:MAG: YfhO family protein [Oscillospiraceae bacterium]
MANKKRILSILMLFIPPVIIMAVLLFAFYKGGLYPFGENSLSWCDMDQQVIPLMIDFKDILDGKSSMFLNFENAGGMNFWGVFFFFLASPFTFLVKFVAKENIILFVNILVMLKLMLSSFTAMIYFRHCHKELDSSIAVTLSVLYGFCGYGMMFYQNIVWLDMMYLFPLLMISLKALINNKKILPYVVTLTAMVVVNYYISYMIVVFLLIFMGLYVFMSSKDKAGENCVRFFGGSALAALLSAVVWLPSFLQFKTSARGKSVIESLTTSKFLTSYETTMQLIYCSAFILIVVFINAMSGKERTKQMNMYLYLFVLTLVPLFIEPINKMWHTGNYMSFPGRYAFITSFMGLICCAYFLSQNHKLKSLSFVLPSLLIPIPIVIIYGYFSNKFITGNYNTIINYVKTLWGNQDSWLKVTELFVIAAACYGVIYMLYRKGFLLKEYFAILICVVAVVEGYANSRIYITSVPYVKQNNVQNQQQVLDLADKIDDDSFFRVKTSSKLFDYNLMGSLGYPSISHYTSLTSKDYMFTMKRLGYTSVWMEAGSSGGTDMTDSMLSIGYEISYGSDTSDSVYSNQAYSINRLDNKIGLGLITANNLSDKTEIPAELERSDVQQYLFSSLYNDNQLVNKYQFSSLSDTLYYEDGYHISGTGSLYYNIHVSGKQKLYFDCFDKLTNNLSEPIYNSFSVRIDGETVESSYPYNKNNGVLYLGEYENQDVSIEVSVLQPVICSSFGVFGINEYVLNDAVSSSRSVNFQRDKGSLYGKCNAEEGESCFLSIPYDTGLTIKINGEKVDYQKTFSAFVSFPLQAGENEITVTYTPNGFVPGLILSIMGLALVVLYIKFRSRINFSDKICSVGYYVTGAVGVIVLLVIYAVPVLINIL